MHRVRFVIPALLAALVPVAAVAQTSVTLDATSGTSAIARNPSSVPGDDRLSSRKSRPESHTHTSSTLTKRQRWLVRDLDTSPPGHTTTALPTALSAGA